MKLNKEIKDKLDRLIKADADFDEDGPMYDGVTVIVGDTFIHGRVVSYNNQYIELDYMDSAMSSEGMPFDPQDCVEGFLFWDEIKGIFFFVDVADQCRAR